MGIAVDGLKGRDRLSTSPAQEVDYQVCSLRLLFGDPVPAIRDDRIFDVIGDTLSGDATAR